MSEIFQTLLQSTFLIKKKYFSDSYEAEDLMSKHLAHTAPYKTSNALPGLYKLQYLSTLDFKTEGGDKGYRKREHFSKCKT